MPNSEVVISFHVATDVAVETVVDVGQDVTTQAQIGIEFTQYQGTIIHYETFNTEFYKKTTRQIFDLASEEDIEALYQFVGEECFGDKENTLVGYTPEAAEEIAKQLPVYATLNIPNPNQLQRHHKIWKGPALPPGFSLRKTADKKLVLDYTESSEVLTPSIFEPATYPPLEENSTEITDEITGKLPTNIDGLINYLPMDLCALLSSDDSQALAFFEQLSIRIVLEQEDRTLSPKERISQRLNDLTWKKPFIIQDFETFKKLLQYNSVEFTLLSSFIPWLQERDDYPITHIQYDLRAVLNAFDFLLGQLNALCDANGIPYSDLLNQLKPNIPNKLGHPSVYMERLLTILTNARDFKEQLRGINELPLTNYGAYHASYMENFKLVLDCMQFDYNPRERQNEYSTKQMYAKSLEKLISAVESIKAGGFQLPYRFNGQQAHAPTLDKLKQLFDDFYAQNKSPIKPNYLGVLTVISFCISLNHELSEEETNDLEVIFQLLLNIRGTSGAKFDEAISPILEKLIRAFYRWHEQGILFTLSQLKTLLPFFVQLDSLETKQQSGSQIVEEQNQFVFALCDKFIQKMQEDRYAFLRLLKAFEKSPPQAPLVETYIDVAEYLQKDAPNVGVLYKHDLLLLSFLISTISPPYTHRNAEKESDKYAEIQAKLDQIKRLLQSSTEDNQKGKNLRYAFQRFLLGGIPIHSLDKLEIFIQVFNAITEVSSENDIVLWLQENHFIAENSQQMVLPEIDHHVVKTLLKNCIMEMSGFSSEPSTEPAEESKSESKSESESENDFAVLKQQKSEELSEKNIQELIGEFNTLYSNLPLQEQAIVTVVLPSIMKDALAVEINRIVQIKQSTDPFLTALEITLKAIYQTRLDSSFDQLNQFLIEINLVVLELETMVAREDYDPKDCAMLIDSIHQDINVIILADLLHFCGEPQKLSLTLRLELVKLLLKEQDQTQEIGWLLTALTDLIQADFPQAYLKRVVSLFKDNTDFDVSIQRMQAIFEMDPNDPVLAWLLSDTSTLNEEQVKTILKMLPLYSESINREALCDFFKSQHSDKLTTFLSHIETQNPENTQTRILILSKAKETYLSINPTATVNEAEILTVYQQLESLEDTELGDLKTFYEKSPAPFNCLQDCLSKRTPEKPFSDVLKDFKRNPYGPRPNNRYDTTEVDRVINELRDLQTEDNYDILYRTQLKNAFLFVNEYGKAVVETLDEDELRNAFLDLKEKQPKSLSDWLMALALSREAMYRATGKFPYSTQIIALLDSMMHEGNLLQSIATGQGKSITDSMLGALLYLDAKHVLITTSSLGDCRRDVAGFSPFFSTLGIPYAKKPITSRSEIVEFEASGINYSTAIDFNLFLLNRGELEGQSDAIFGNEKVSIIINEFDDAMLNNHVVSRLSTTDEKAPAKDQDWIYREIRHTVERSNHFKQFLKEQKREQIDFIKAALLRYVTEKLPPNKKAKNNDYVQSLTDERILGWIEACHTVSKLERDGRDFTVSQPVLMEIDGIVQETRLVHPLMLDQQINTQGQFGNGVQQILCDKINEEDESRRKRKVKLVIPRESKTLLASMSCNLFEQYLNREGVIRGSSATPGSTEQRKTLDTRYQGLAFSNVPSHQPNIVKQHDPIECDNATLQHEQVADILAQYKKSKRPCLIICKDIKTAKALHQFLTGKIAEDTLNYFDGTPDSEKEALKNAAEPGKITVVTIACGRNKDIPYKKIGKDAGMNVIYTAVEPENIREQGIGRTGRGGSPGDVHFVYNKEDYPGSTWKTLAETMERESDAEREHKEWLYRLLSHFFAEYKKTLPENLTPQDRKARIIAQWSPFLEHVEKLYKDTVPKNATKEQKDTFLEVAIEQLCNTGLSTEDQTVLFSLLENNAPIVPIVQGKTPVSTKQVRVSEAASPAILALRYDCATVERRNFWIKRILDNSLLKNSDLVELAKTLTNQTTSTESSFKEDIQSFFNKISQAKSVSQLVKDHQSMHFLENLLFSETAIRSTERSTMINLTIKKQLVSALLSEYMSQPFYIQSRRKASVQDLEKTIQMENNDNDEHLIRLLINAQKKITTDDIEENKTRWRALHRTGSRYQDTLTHAIDLLISLNPALSHKIEHVFKEQRSNEAETQVVDNSIKLKYDHLESQSSSTFFQEKDIDIQNAKVLEKSAQLLFGRQLNRETESECFKKRP